MNENTLIDHQGNLTATIHGNAVERLGYDAWGRRLDRIICGEGNILTVGVGGLPEGVYAYRIYNAESTVLKGKIIKE